MSPVPLALQTLDVVLRLLWEEAAWFQQGSYATSPHLLRQAASLLSISCVGIH